MSAQPGGGGARHDFGILLNLAYGVFKDGLTAHLAAAGFDDLGTSFGYVFRLLEPQPTNLRFVADRLGITPQGALKLISEMVAKGYVERHDHPNDGRVKHLLLTPRARSAMTAARAYHAGFEQQLGDRLGTDVSAIVRAALEEIVGTREGTAAQDARPL